MLLIASAIPCAAAEPVPWRALPSGLQVRTLQAIPSPELPVEAWLVRLDSGRHELRALVPGAGGPGDPAAPSPRLASLLGPEVGALAVLNASYFDERGRPLGLLVEDGRMLSRANERGWAWAAISSGRLVLRQAREEVPPGVTQAVQAGPLLVRAGAALPSSSPRRARRSFLGSDASGRIVLGATNGSLLLGELAALLARPESEGGAGLVEAINLDGGSSSQLWIAGDEPPLKVGGIPVPAFVAVFPRPEGSGP